MAALMKNNTTEKYFGKIVAIEGQVVTVEFEPNNMPLAQDVLVLKNDQNIKMEVIMSSADNTFFCLAFSPTDKLYRGAEVINTHSPIKIPVGDEVLGRLINIFGEALDGKGPIIPKKTESIYA